MKNLARGLRLDEAAWRALPDEQLSAKAMTVFFAYALAAFNRFGLIAVLSPRAFARLLLIGLYGWIGLAAAGWLLSRWRSEQPVSIRTAAIATGVVHSPLVALGLVIAFIGGFARLQGPGLIAAWLLVGLWMPALLAWAYRRLSNGAWSIVIPAAIGTHVVWLATVGRYLYDQVGHLL